jgi:imidazolonepropionase-like amidohydrolase
MLLANCHVIDAVTPDPIRNTSIRIEGNRIAGIGDTHRNDIDEPVIDLGGAYVTPGLWDSHCHLGLLIPDPTGYCYFETLAERAVRAGHTAQDALRVGLTSLKVVGEASGIDLAWRDAFKAGMHKGPRIFAAGKIIRATGGHGSTGKKKFLYVEDGIEADGEAEFAHAARLQLKMGVDFIKICITGGMALDETFGEPQMFSEEMAAVIRATHAKGKKVTAHAGGAPAVKAALKVGLDAVEHGYQLDEECIAIMAAQGAFLTPTIGVTHDEAFARKHNWPEPTIQKAKEGMPAHRLGVEMAKAYGVPICSGGDKYPIAESGIREIELLGQVGLSNFEALQAATINSARFLGVGDLLGTIEVGKLADLAIFAEDPLADLANLHKLCMVVKDGEVVVDHILPSRVQQPVLSGVTHLGIPLSAPVRTR